MHDGGAKGSRLAADVGQTLMAWSDRFPASKTPADLATISLAAMANREQPTTIVGSAGWAPATFAPAAWSRITGCRQRVAVFGPFSAI